MVPLKLRLLDNTDLRDELCALYEKASVHQLCRYAIWLSTHVLNMINYTENVSAIAEAYALNKDWREGKSSIKQVRLMALQIHKMARSADTEIKRLALRVVGQAMSTPHVPEHVIIASDYAIKLLNTMHGSTADTITRERKWQVDCLQSIITE